MKKIQPKYDTINKGHYTPGIISRGMLYISGQLSKDPDTAQVATGGIDEHMRLALSNVDRVLKTAEVPRSNVVYCKVYIADIADWDIVNQLYAEFFGEHKPARIVCPVSKLHFGCLVEIEAIAEVNEA